GFYELKRTVALPRVASGQRSILHFDTVNYFSRVLVNESLIGTMGPYVPYEFDITPLLRDGANSVSVRIADLRPEPDGSGRYGIPRHSDPRTKLRSKRQADRAARGLPA